MEVDVALQVNFSRQPFPARDDDLAAARSMAGSNGFVDGLEIFIWTPSVAPNSVIKNSRSGKNGSLIAGIANGALTNISGKGTASASADAGSAASANPKPNNQQAKALIIRT